MFHIFGKRKNKEAQSESNAFDTGSIRSVVVTDLGNIRTNNEDVGLFFRIADDNISREKGCLLLVADGMGGHNAGEVASRMAAETISHEYVRIQANAEKSLHKAYELANTKIYQLSLSNRTMSGMGTTCTALAVIDATVYFAHAGDSRAFMLKNGTISQITEDHTYVQELVNQGEITLAEADVHPKRNILTNAMGTKPTLRIDTGKFALPFEENDRLMICSDGLYDYISNEELGRILGGTSLHETAKTLVTLAKTRGGHDNITVVLAERVPVAREIAEKETRDIDIPLTQEFDLP